MIIDGIEAYYLHKKNSVFWGLTNQTLALFQALLLDKKQ